MQEISQVCTQLHTRGMCMVETMDTWGVTVTCCVAVHTQAHLTLGDRCVRTRVWGWDPGHADVGLVSPLSQAPGPQG